MWQIQKTSTLFEHPRITLLEDDILLPDGTHTKYLKFLNKGDGADIVVINDEQKILLQKEYNHPVGTELWQFPGGFIDAGETPLQAAQRELLEEAGYQAETFEQIGHHHIYRRRISEVSNVFVATNLKFVGEDRELSEMGMSHAWFTPQEIDAMVRKGEITASDALAIWLIFKTNYPKGQA